MIDVSLSTLAEVLGGLLVGADTSVDAVSTDSRQCPGQCLFIALIGERFDAHDFAASAVENGAKALLVSRTLDLPVPQVVVSDTHEALGKLGAWVNSQCNVTTVAMTGSCGKTTVKEMAASILSRKGKVLATAGNFNNDIGVPLTLLRLTPEYDFAVIELGANHIGEISYTTSLVKPDAALVNNLAAAHLEGFGSLEGVAKAKGEIFEGLASGAAAVVNLDSMNEALWAQLLSDKRVVTFSSTKTNADFHAKTLERDAGGCYRFVLVSPQGEAEVTLPIAGQHNVSNALAAAALTMSVSDISLEDVADGLTHTSHTGGRVAMSEPRPGLRVIDDTYNASVAAMKAAADLLGGFDGRTLMVVGDMKELGEQSVALHAEVGDHIAALDIDDVVSFGADSEAVTSVTGGKHFTDKDSLIQHVLNMTKDQEITVLVKGARSMKMEEVVMALKESAQ
ncbi:UDP-N-acetylmuramoyl-tripeptide--D-alanyl-D-alanine ligase [Parasalinivibrio latis]|uniref:UDP-N-acetylmuramoyl-tripeptide--D-alanyl-D- alanine ligase n=1 Tax=Parasalinivibrio latis TaxID=2952610 RepID=UPI0030E31870